jgi:hypothetical protein
VLFPFISSRHSARCSALVIVQVDFLLLLITVDKLSCHVSAFDTGCVCHFCANHAVTSVYRCLPSCFVQCLKSRVFSVLCLSAAYWNSVPCDDPILPCILHCFRGNSQQVSKTASFRQWKDADHLLCWWIIYILLQHNFRNFMMVLQLIMPFARCSWWKVCLKC